MTRRAIEPQDVAQVDRSRHTEDRGTFYLVYNAKTKGRNWVEQTGVAMSREVKTWTRYAEEPADSRRPEGQPRRALCQRSVRWVFFHYSLGQGKARDLLPLGDTPFTPRKVDEILIDVGPPGSVDEAYAHKPSVVWRDSALDHFYCAVSGRYPRETRGISVARGIPF